MCYNKVGYYNLFLIILCLSKKYLKMNINKNVIMPLKKISPRVFLFHLLLFWCQTNQPNKKDTISLQFDAGEYSERRQFTISLFIH